MNLKKLINSDTYDLLRRSYITLFIIAVFTRVLMPIASHETQLINTLVFSIVAFYGAFVICIDFFSRRIMFKSPNVIWLMIFILVCVISSLINIQYGLLGNIRNTVWLAISFFLLYPVDNGRSQNSVKSEIKYISNILIIVWTIACFISIIMFLLKIGYYIDIFPDSFSRQGFIEGRLFGIFEDPNFAAVVAIVVIILNVFNIKTVSKRILKAFYIISIVFNYIYVVLSGSRTAEVALAVTSFILIYFIFFKESKNYKLNKVIKQILIVLMSLIISLAVVLSIPIAKKVMSYLPNLIGVSFNSTNMVESRLKKPIDTTREDITNSSDLSNCRFKIWISAIELFKSKPIFGTSPRNMRSYAKVEIPNGFIAKRSYAVHNAYIDVLTSTGIIGAIAIAVFFIKYLYDIFKYFFSKEKKENYYIVLFNFSIVATIAISAVFLSEIFFVNTIGVLMFWLNLGYSYFYINKDKEKFSRVSNN